ncbi:hypothetical protein PSPO01_10572 [Paraphaeosphaeria sporulosa]
MAFAVPWTLRLARTTSHSLRLLPARDCRTQPSALCRTSTGRRRSSVSMDPISLTAGCLALVATISKTSTIVTGFVREVREARHGLDVVSRELSSLQTVLGLLAEDASQNNPVSFPDALQAQIHGIITNCNEVVLEMKYCLTRHENSKLGQAGYWTVGGGKEHMARLRSTLEAHKSALEIALDMMAIIIARDTKKDTSQILDVTAAIREDTAQILEEVARLRTQLPRNMAGEQTNGNEMLRRYLDSLTSYAGTVYDAETDDRTLSSRSASPMRASEEVTSTLTATISEKSFKVALIQPATVSNGDSESLVLLPTASAASSSKEGKIRLFSQITPADHRLRSARPHPRLSPPEGALEPQAPPSPSTPLRLKGHVKHHSDVSSGSPTPRATGVPTPNLIPHSEALIQKDSQCCVIEHAVHAKMSSALPPDSAHESKTYRHTQFTTLPGRIRDYSLRQAPTLSDVLIVVTRPRTNADYTSDDLARTLRSIAGNIRQLNHLSWRQFTTCIVSRHKVACFYEEMLHHLMGVRYAGKGGLKPTSSERVLQARKVKKNQEVPGILDSRDKKSTRTPLAGNDDRIIASLTEYTSYHTDFKPNGTLPSGIGPPLNLLYLEYALQGEWETFIRDLGRLLGARTCMLIAVGDEFGDGELAQHHEDVLGEKGTKRKEWHYAGLPSRRYPRDWRCFVKKDLLMDLPEYVPARKP